MDDEDRRSIQRMPRLTRRPTHPTIMRVGNFILGERIGQGGMGAVYVATHEKLRSKVAVKLIQPHVAEVPGSRERFFDEARLTASLSHPGLVRIHDFGQLETGELYSVMELLEGEDVESVLQRDGALPLARVVPIAIQVAAALALVHDHGIVHRDIKPENIFLARAGDGSERAVVLDFGIARKPGRAAGRAPSAPIDIAGTPAYMAPEQARSEAIDGRADIYALGCALHEMVTGLAPFTGETTSDVLVAHQIQPPPPLGGAAAPLGPLLARCMAKHADDRGPDMRALRAALQAVRLR